jgi:hypothetical protein
MFLLEGGMNGAGQLQFTDSYSYNYKVRDGRYTKLAIVSVAIIETKPWAERPEVRGLISGRRHTFILSTASCSTPGPTRFVLQCVPWGCCRRKAAQSCTKLHKAAQSCTKHADLSPSVAFS